jgi:nitroreductase
MRRRALHPGEGADMDLASCDRLLTTTRSVRRRLDFSRPVPRELIERCVEIALQAPTGSNAQGWHFYVVTDPAKKKALRDLYKTGFDLYLGNDSFRPKYAEADLRAAQRPRVEASATYLAEHLHEAPALVIPCIEGRVEQGGVLAQASIYGSILPAAWSFMLALRARGLGAAWTTLHLMYEKEAAKLLGIPDHVTQTALLPVAYTKGSEFQVARRLPVSAVTHWDRW